MKRIRTVLFLSIFVGRLSVAKPNATVSFEDSNSSLSVSQAVLLDTHGEPLCSANTVGKPDLVPSFAQAADHAPTAHSYFPSCSSSQLDEIQTVAENSQLSAQVAGVGPVALGIGLCVVTGSISAAADWLGHIVPVEYSATVGGAVGVTSPVAVGGFSVFGHLGFGVLGAVCSVGGRIVVYLLTPELPEKPYVPQTYKWCSDYSSGC